METLTDLLEASAARFRNKPALLIKPGFRTRKWTFADLAELVPRVATVLAESGIRRGDAVVLWAPPRPEWAIAFFALARIGALVVPLDANSLAEFASKVAQRTRAKAVLAATQTLPGARALGLQLHAIESLPDLARGKPAHPKVAASPDDLVEVIFTSGTTGEPKGAMITHRNIVSNARSVAAVFPLSPRERLLTILPLSHMFGQTAALVTPIFAGASIAFGTSLQPATLLRSFRDHRPTVFVIIPQGLRLFERAIDRKVDSAGRRAVFEKLHVWARRLPFPLRKFLFLPIHAQFGGRLRYIGVGAAALDPALGTRWEERGFEVIQGYGTTECSPVISFNRPGHNRMGTVGQAVPDVEVRIADDGEVLVRGPNVFPGYWENEEATRAVLENGWYQTGDLGTLDRDGYLTLRGRKKDMLVLDDGTNVYLDDVETILNRDARLRDSAVIGLTRPGETLHVHAVLLLDDASAAKVIVDDANAKLGSHQKIRGFTVWPDDDFPRTLTRKVKKRDVLERLERASTTAADAPAAPTVAATPLAMLVAQIANAPAANVRREARLTSDLGLDSLGRVELLGAIEEELGVSIDDAMVDPETTVAQLEAMVASASGERKSGGIYGWPLHPLVRLFGLFLWESLIAPLTHFFYRVKVTGVERLGGLRGPVLFAPNHCLHWDNLIILTSIPLSWRWHLSVAAAADDIFGDPVRGLSAAILGNAFPLSREGAIRRSLELLGARLDRDFSVLIYPEGKLTVGGPMQPFKSGTGLIAVEGGTPVVPMKLKIKRMSLADRLGWPLRGDVEVVFGEPLVFRQDTSFNDATKEIETAVAAL